MYKSIKDNNPILWDEKESRPSSAAFKDSRGLSVDRQGERNHDECCNRLRQRFASRAVVFTTVEVCIASGCTPVYDPVEDNIYHSLIKDANGNITLSSPAAKRLRAVRQC